MASKKFWQITGGLVVCGILLLLLTFLLVRGDLSQLRFGETHWYRTFHF